MIAPSSAARLDALRQQLKNTGVEGYINPTQDAFQSEYPPAHARRIAWLTGFTGSAGVVAVLAEKAALFSDGRYTLQMQQQVPADGYTCHTTPQETPEGWLRTHGQGIRLGYDPWLWTPRQLAPYEALETEGVLTLAALEDNPIDAIWDDQPAPPCMPVRPHPLDHAGQDSPDKRQQLAKTLAAQKLDAAWITAPDAIAWLLNMRGGDIPYNPLPLSYALLHQNGEVDWFIDPRKLTDEVQAALGAGVHVRPIEELAASITSLKDKKILLSPAQTPVWFFHAHRSANIEPIPGDDPCLLPKACKNETELAGMREAHRRDGLALCRFFAWLEAEIKAGQPPDELACMDKLLAFRQMDPHFREPSFETIAGSGPNGAIVHYHAETATSRRLTAGELFLCDSGGQYPQGTTDVTRTILPAGEATEAQKRHFTLVLKGHIRLARAVFPEGTTGAQLDALARYDLWGEGLDYAHGTGHGVGSYLCVHEGPQNISRRASGVALQPGMILSNEPGYYEPGSHGIRIENLVAVLPADTPGFLRFETLTLAPIDRRLILPSLLTAAETDWLNAYHRHVCEALSPALEEPVKSWLQEATAPLYSTDSLT